MKKAFFILAFICFFAFGAQGQTRINVRLAVETRVENNLVALGDLAQISGGGEKAERMRMISLGYAPNIGLTREITREKILLAIAAAGFLPNEFSLEAPAVLRVRRAGQEINQNQIREAIEKAVFGQFADGKVQARIARIDLPEKIDVPVGKIDFRVNLANVQNLFAPFALSVEIRVNDLVARRLSANIEIEAYAEVLVAEKDLAVNAKITESDVRLERRRLEKPLTSYLCDAAKLRGVKLIKNLQVGAPLAYDAFISETVVRTGDLVRIFGQAGRLQITVSGQARSAGRIGDRIAVKNLQSNSIIQATVMDEGLVKVLF